MGGWLFGFLDVVDRDNGPVTHTTPIRPNGPAVRLLPQFPLAQLGIDWPFEAAGFTRTS